MTCDPNQPKPKAYSYVRMSTPEQRNGDSARRQIARSREYAARNHLDLVLNQFDDIGVSAFRGKHAELGALRRFIELVTSGEIVAGSYLLVESMDRLSRQKVMVAFAMLNQIISMGISVVTLDDGQLYSGEVIENQFPSLLIALAAMSRSHEESKRKSGMLTAVWGEKRSNARHTPRTVATKRVPGWLLADRATDQITPIEERVALVVRIFEMVRDGWGAYSVARKLNEERIKPWGTRKNAIWRESYIKKLIRGRAVLGEYQPHIMTYPDGAIQKRVPSGDVIRLYYPIVVSELLYSAANLAMSRRSSSGKGRKGASYSNLFTGLLRCSCGGGYRYLDKGKPPKGGQYLQCSLSHAKGSCAAKPYRYQTIEGVILSALTSIDIALVLGGEAQNKRIGELKQLALDRHVEREDINKELNRVLRVVSSTDTEAPRALSQQLSLIESRLSQAVRLEHEAHTALDEALELDPAKRSAQVETLVSQIRAADGTPQNEHIRRALVGELQRMISYIRVSARSDVAWEILDGDPNWRKKYGVKNEDELRQALIKNNFELTFVYRSGDIQTVIPLEKRNIRTKPNPKFKEWTFYSQVSKQ